MSRDASVSSGAAERGGQTLAKPHPQRTVGRETSRNEVHAWFENTPDSEICGCPGAVDGRIIGDETGKSKTSCNKPTDTDLEFKRFRRVRGLTCYQ